MCPRRSDALPMPRPGVVTGTVPKAEAVKKLEAERKVLGGDDNRALSRMDAKASQKVGSLQRQLEALRGWVMQGATSVVFSQRWSNGDCMRKDTMPTVDAQFSALCPLPLALPHPH